MQNDSIYQLIQQNALKYPSLPYVFQNVENSGKEDVLLVKLETELPAMLRNHMAYELMKLLMQCLKENQITSKLTDLLQERRFCLYAEEFRKRIFVALQEEKITKEQLYTFGMKLMKDSRNMEEVKMAIVISSFSENDIVKKMIQVLGYHSAFTYYAILAAKQFDNYNAFVYDLAQNTAGYGHYIAVDCVEPLSKEQKEYLFHEAIYDEVTTNYTCGCMFTKVEMWDYYQELDFSVSDNRRDFAFLLAHAVFMHSVETIDQSYEWILRMFQYADEFATFGELAACCVLYDNMIQSLENKRYQKEEYWNHQKVTSVLALIKPVLERKLWYDVVDQALTTPTMITGIVMLVLNVLDYHPGFFSFLPMLEKDNYDITIMEFALIKNSSIYVRDVRFYLMEMLPDEVFSGSKDVFDQMLSMDYIKDLWLYYLLIAMRKEQIQDEKLYLDCLNARFEDVRIEAIHNLRVNRLYWSDKVVPALQDAYRTETVKKVKKRIARLLDKRMDDTKLQQYVDIPDGAIEMKSYDRKIMETEIAGTLFHDLLVVEGHLEVMDCLYLVREPDNQYDKNAILVTAEDGYVLGYIPKRQNKLLAQLMDEGNRLYAVLLSDDVSQKQPPIRIMLSEKIKEEGNVIHFPGCEEEMR